MELSFFASPSDIKGLFEEIEAATPLHYYWGYGGPFADVLGPFNSCHEIDCFGYAVDHTYRLDFNIEKEPFQIVQNMNGYYNRSCALSLMLNGTTGTGGVDKALSSAIISCPMNAPQNGECRKLFFRIKRRMNKGWHKIDGMYFGCEVYDKRKYQIFMNREGYIESPFYFNDEDVICEVSPNLHDKLESLFINAPFVLPAPDPIIHFYSSDQDVVELLQNIEKQFSIKYKFYKGPLQYSDETFISFSELRQVRPDHNKIFAYDSQYHNSIEISLGDFQGSVVAPGSVSFDSHCPKYGGTLLRSIQERIAKTFNPVYIKHYGIYYLSPNIWEAKERIIFDNGDPRFRWENGEFVNVLRAEWEAMSHYSQ